jgi:hypothetical protein
MDHALNIMQNALTFKRQHESSYIQFLSHFGPALTGMAFWNNNKTTKLVGELLTITDEAFILLCIINYSATWKAQEKQKLEDTNVLIPVSYIHSVLVCDSTGKQRITNRILIASPLGSPRLQTWQTNCLATMTAQASTCYVDGLAMDSKSSKEVCKNRQEHGEDFDKAFKNTMEEDMASTNKAGKRKRNGIDTYNDLNASALIMKDAETGAGGEEEEEEWVSKHVFTV